MSNANFDTFWRAHKQTILTMLQPTNLTVVTAEQYMESQTKLAAELIYTTGAKDGGADKLAETTELLRILNKEMQGSELSAEEKACLSILDADEVPAFIQEQAGDGSQYRS